MENDSKYKNSFTVLMYDKIKNKTNDKPRLKTIHTQSALRAARMERYTQTALFSGS